MVLLTHLSKEAADAVTVSELYRKRWGIATAFQKLERDLHSEINALGYPKAAWFGFCLALVAFNIDAMVMAALRATHPDQAINQEVSEYYIAQEIATTYTGMLIAVPPQEWTVFTDTSPVELNRLLLDLASKVNLAKLRKNPRGPKKPPNPRNQFKGMPQVSTAKLLAAAAAG